MLFHLWRLLPITIWDGIGVIRGSRCGVTRLRLWANKNETWEYQTIVATVWSCLKQKWRYQTFLVSRFPASLLVSFFSFFGTELVPVCRLHSGALFHFWTDDDLTSLENEGVFSSLCILCFYVFARESSTFEVLNVY